MQQKPVKQNINGWLVIDKSYDIGSTQVVGKLKHLFHPMKIGHGGTLDPLATGVLPIAFGEATRTVPFVMDGLKIYSFKIKFGISTSTDDVQGEITQQSTLIPKAQDIVRILPQLTGNILQTPPIFSALKVGGQRAYILARRGENVTLAPRPVFIKDLQLTEQTDVDEFLFQVVCGKGTYVRSLGRDIAEKLGACGHITFLRRVACGVFTIKESITLDKLEKFVYNNPSKMEFIPVETVLTDILELALTKREALDLSYGRFLARRDLADIRLMKATEKGKLVAFVKVKDGIVRPIKVFKKIKGENDVD